jgi:iron complex outermembrane recepter protein
MTTKNGALRKRYLTTAVSLALGNVLGQSAFAQSSDQNSMILEEVMVTAERRTERLQDVPISATVFSSDALADMGVKNVADLQQLSPSLAINTYNRSTFINIRGIGMAQSAPTTSPGVAFYLDGVFIPHEFTIGTSFYDINSVEVLRGPQGTLTGQNSTGGALYLRTPAPAFGEWSGFLDQTLAEYSWTKTIGAVNIPIGEKLAIRASGVIEERDSYSKNLRLPSPPSLQSDRLSEPGNVDYRGYRVALAYQPIEALRVNLRYEDYLNDYDNNAIKNRNDAITRDPFTIEEDAISYLKQDGYRTSGEITFDFSNVRLRWLSAAEHGIYTDASDGDRTATAAPRVAGNAATNANVGRVTYGRTKINTAIHELNVLSTGDSALNWVVGAFHLEDTTDIAIHRHNNSTVTGNTAPTAITLTKAEVTSKSAFGQVGYKFSEQWQLSVGTRYSEDEQVYDRDTASTAAAPGVGIQESNEVTGRVALNWTPVDDLLLYTSVSKGYKAGGVNLRPIDPNFGPETNVVGEVGFKTTVLDGHLRLNGDVFYSNYEDIQFLSLVVAGTPPVGAPVQQNAGKAKSRGAELEILGAWGDFQVNAGLAYLDAELSEDTTLQNALTNTNQLVRSGSRLPFSPEITANLGVQYTFAIGAGSLTPRVQVSYLDDQLATLFPAVSTTVPSRTLTDVRVSYEPTEAWRIEAFATNVFDKTYIASQVQNATSFDGGIIYGAPRVLGGRVTYSFK